MKPLHILVKSAVILIALTSPLLAQPKPLPTHKIPNTYISGKTINLPLVSIHFDIKTGSFLAKTFKKAGLFGSQSTVKAIGTIFPKKHRGEELRVCITKITNANTPLNLLAKPRECLGVLTYDAELSDDGSYQYRRVAPDILKVTIPSQYWPYFFERN